jgi:hypothetical protein
MPGRRQTGRGEIGRDSAIGGCERPYDRRETGHAMRLYVPLWSFSTTPVAVPRGADGASKGGLLPEDAQQNCHPADRGQGETIGHYFSNCARIFVSLSLTHVSISLLIETVKQSRGVRRARRERGALSRRFACLAAAIEACLPTIREDLVKFWRAIAFGLRRSCATLLLAARVPSKVVQERLGHRKIGTTLDTYAHVLPSMQRDAARQLAALSPAGESATWLADG